MLAHLQARADRLIHHAGRIGVILARFEFHAADRALGKWSEVLARTLAKDGAKSLRPHHRLNERLCLRSMQLVQKAPSHDIA